MSKKTLEDYAGNGDGTYNARGLVQFLMAATTGKELTDAEAQEIVDEAKARAKAKRGE